MAVNLLTLETPERFEEFCCALLCEEFPRFHAFSGPDLGMDGFDSDSGTIYQAYFPERSPRKDKIQEDLKKAKRQGDACKGWVLLLPKDPSAPLSQWLQGQQKQLELHFSVSTWGKTELLKRLRKHSHVQEHYFPTELKRELRRLVKGKRPAAGDADSVQAVTAEEAAQLYELIGKVADDEAARKKRKPRRSDYSREYGEFNSHFHLSSYDLLPASRFLEARRYLERKQYARRGGETSERERSRCLSGIKAIQKDLGISDSAYRQLLLEVSGRTSTTQLNLPSLRQVFQHFQRLQGRKVARQGD